MVDCCICWFAVAQAAADPAGIGAALKRGPEDFLEKAVVGPRGDGAYVVPTTQVVQPAGQTLEFSGRPVDLAMSPDGGFLAIKNRMDVVFVDVASRAIVQTLPLPNKAGSTFVGLAWSNDSKKLWLTETKSYLRSAVRGEDGKYAWTDAFVLPGMTADKEPNAAAGGIVWDDAAGVAYVTLSRRNSLAVVNLATGKVDAEIPVGIAPYTVLTVGRKAYVTNWGGRVPREGDFTGPTSGSRAVVDPKTGIAASGTVSVVDLDARTAKSEIEVGLHPCGMAPLPRQITALRRQRQQRHGLGGRHGKGCRCRHTGREAHGRAALWFGAERARGLTRRRHALRGPWWKQRPRRR